LTLSLCSNVPSRPLSPTPKQPPGTVGTGRQLLVNVSLEEWSLEKFNMVEEAFATERWLCVAVHGAA